MKTLIFVYNADAGLFSQVTDFAHKVLSPGTYACNLCKLTYGNIGVKKEWKEFLGMLPAEKQFLHRNEFATQYPTFANIALPAIFMLEEEKLTSLITSDEINRMQELKDLQSLIRGKIQA